MTDLSCFRVTVDNEQDVDLKEPRYVVCWPSKLDDVRRILNEPSRKYFSGQYMGYCPPTPVIADDSVMEGLSAQAVLPTASGPLYELDAAREAARAWVRGQLVYCPPPPPRPHKCQWRPLGVHRGPNWRRHNIKWADWLPLCWWVSAHLKREWKGKTFTMPPWWFPFGAAYGPSWSRFQDNLTDKPL